MNEIDDRVCLFYVSDRLKEIFDMFQDDYVGALKELDRVAYLRFASVYKDFQETDDFRKFIDKNLNLKNE